MPVPDIPGRLVERRSPQDMWLRHHVANICQLDNERCVVTELALKTRKVETIHGCRFPGAQPVSFSTGDLDKLEKAE